VQNVIMANTYMDVAMSKFVKWHGDDVIATSPWVQGDCEMPHRVVLRDTKNAVICHLQVINIPDGLVYFASGFYYLKYANRAPSPFVAAWAIFERRCRRHLGIEL
jgi:hypothetical protein